jgi:hypothetical protein
MSYLEQWTKAKDAYQQATHEKRPTGAWYKTGTGLTPSLEELDAWLVVWKADLKGEKYKKGDYKAMDQKSIELAKINLKISKAGDTLLKAIFKETKVVDPKDKVAVKKAEATAVLERSAQTIFTNMDKELKAVRAEIKRILGSETIKEKGKVVWRDNPYASHSL